MMLAALLLIASYLSAAAGLWGMLLALVRPRETGDTARLGLAALMLGPIALAWVLAQAMRIAPGTAPGVLALMVSAAILVPVVVFRRRLATATGELWRAGLDRRLRMALGLVALLAALAALITYGLPLGENDALEYATAARLIYEARSIALYPFVDSQASGGFYGPWTHPAGYPSLMVWSNIVQGGAAEPGLIRVPSWYSACATMLLLVGLGGGGGAVAALVLASTPIYFLATIDTFVDPVRVGAAFAALALSEQCARLGLDLRRAVACGIAVGLAFFMHSIGVTLFPMAFALLLLYGSARLRERLVGIVLAFVVAIAAVLPDLAGNLRSFGTIVADTPAVWSVPQVGYQEFMRVTRGIATFEEQVVNGVLQGLFGTIYYGFSYWLWLVLGLAAGILALRSRGLPTLRSLASVHVIPHERRWMLLSAAFVCMWGAMAFAALLAGSVEFVKNIRYGLTVLPFVALFCGLAVATGLRQQAPWAGWRWPPRVGRGALAVVAAALACGGSLTLIGIYLVFLMIQYPVTPDWLDLTGREMLAGSRRPTVHVTRRVDKLLEGGGCALLFRQADYAWYGKGCYRSYLDHRLIEMYRSDQPDRVAAVLAQHNIRVIVVPRYGLPEISNTAIEAFLADPLRARLVWSWDGERIFIIGAPPVRVDRKTVARLSDDLHFRDRTGRRATTVRTDARGYNNAELVSGGGSPLVPPGYGTRWTESYSCRQPVVAPVLMELKGTLRGRGHVMLDLFNYRAGGRDSERSVSTTRLWDGVLNGAHHLSLQYVVEPGQCAAQRLRLQLLTPGEVAIESLEVTRLEGAAPDPDTYAASLAEAAGWSSYARRYYSKAWDWGWRVGDGAIVQRVPRSFPHPVVALASPPVVLAPGPLPHRMAVELELAGNSRPRLFVEGLNHIGFRSICRSDGDPLRPAADLMEVLRVQLTAYPAESADPRGHVFQTGGAVPTCYRSVERIALEPKSGSGALARFEAPAGGFDAVRVVFLQSRAPAETGADSELIVRRLKIIAVGTDGAESTLYDFHPRPGELPEIR